MMNFQAFWEPAHDVPFPHLFPSKLQRFSPTEKTPALKAESRLNKIKQHLSVQHQLITQGQSETVASLGGYQVSYLQCPVSKNIAIT